MVQQSAAISSNHEVAFGNTSTTTIGSTVDFTALSDGRFKTNIQENIVKWRALGALPRNARHLDEKFNKAIDAHLGNLNMSKVEIEMMKFENAIETYLAQQDYKKLDNEQYFIHKKIDEKLPQIVSYKKRLARYGGSFLKSEIKFTQLIKTTQSLHIAIDNRSTLN